MPDQHNRRGFLAMGALGLTGLALGQQEAQGQPKEDQPKAGQLKGGQPYDGPVKVKWIKITDHAIGTNQNKRVFFEGWTSTGSAKYLYFVLSGTDSIDWVKLLALSMESSDGSPVQINYTPVMGADTDYAASDTYYPMPMMSVTYTTDKKTYGKCQGIAIQTKK